MDIFWVSISFCAGEKGGREGRVGELLLLSYGGEVSLLRDKGKNKVKGREGGEGTEGGGEGGRE